MPFPFHLFLIIFHPILVTIFVLIVLVFLLRWTGWWARYRYWILGALLTGYLIDAGFALPRVLFAHGLSKTPVVAQQIPLPRRLVLVDLPCVAKCHDLLISGAVEEIITVIPARPQYAGAANALRYTAGWSIPGTCKSKTWSHDPREIPSATQRQNGYCPSIEPVEIPTEGIFLIRESTLVTAREPARRYTPTHLLKAPPGRLIRFAGIEVQDRNPAGTTVLASVYHYTPPGFLGLPPLIGCWDRPDNVIWIMPPGDTGCGFWRWFTWGGDDSFVNDSAWLFDQVFGPPNRAVVPPTRVEFPPPTPKQALEILSQGLDFEFHLLRLRDALLDPSNSDQALTDLVTRSGTLQGSLIALLAANRPSTLANLSQRLNPVPWQFANSGPVLEEMQKNPEFRDEFADTMFLMLASHWQQASSNIDRFLKLMETSHPGWLCEKLGRVNASNDAAKERESRIVRDYGQRCRS
jgi:hypothetical protein